MSRRSKALVILIVILALLGVGVAYRLKQNAAKAVINKQKSQEEQVQTVAVTVAPVAVGDVAATSEVAGSLKPADEINVVPKVQGRTVRVRVDVGDRVNAGAVLAELDKVDLQAQVKQAQAGLVAARARLAQVKAGARTEEVQQAEAALAQAKAAFQGAKRGLDNTKRLYDERTASVQALNAAETQTQVGQAQYESAQALVKQAEASLKSANDNLQRMTDLFAKGAVTRVQLDAAKTQADIARAQYQSAQAGMESARVGLEGARKNLGTAKETHDSQTALQAQLDAAESQYHMAEANVKAAEARLAQVKAGARAEDIEATEAQVLQAEAAVDLAKSQLANAVITAPISGVVSARSIDPGEMTTPGMPVFTIVNTSEVFADVSVTEGLIGKVNDGQSVAVAVDAFPGKSFAGRLTNLSPVADARTRAFSSRIRLANKDGKLKPGMFATVKFATESHKNVVLIPADAIVDRNGDQIVFIVENKTARERAVKTGIGDGHSVEILSGLSQGEQLVVAGQTQLADGVAVDVQNEVK